MDLLPSAAPHWRATAAAGDGWRFPPADPARWGITAADDLRRLRAHLVGHPLATMEQPVQLAHPAGADGPSPGILLLVPRNAEGRSVDANWDVLGMRATRSDDTVLLNTFVPDRYIARVVPPGGAGVDSFVLAVFAWALMGFGNVY